MASQESEGANMQHRDRLPEFSAGAEDRGTQDELATSFRTDLPGDEADLEAGTLRQHPLVDQADESQSGNAAESMVHGENGVGFEHSDLPTSSAAGGGQEDGRGHGHAQTVVRSPTRSTVTMHFFLGDPDVSSMMTTSVAGGLTPWRLPTTVGKLPVYVQNQFRLKTMTVVCLQLLLVVLLMTGLTAGQVARQLPIKMQLVLVIMCILAQGFSLMALYPRKVLRRRHGCLLVLLACTSAIIWDIANSLLGSDLMDLHIGCILFVAMVIATGYASLHARQGRREPRSMVVSSFLTGWVVATLLQFAVMTALDHDCYLVMEAGGLCLMIFLVAAMEVGQGLAESNPDDYVSVITRLNSNLLVIWSIPVIGLCDLCKAICQGSRAQEQEDASLPTILSASPATEGSTTTASTPEPREHEPSAATRSSHETARAAAAALAAAITGTSAAAAAAAAATPTPTPTPIPSARMVLQA